MKKSLLTLLLVMAGVIVMARPVDQNTAVLVARNFALSQFDATRRAALGNKPFRDAHVVYTHTMPTSGNAAIYAVDLGTGFVLVSADDVAHPVLGYNLGRTWPKQTLAAQVSSYLDDLARQIESAAGNEPDSETAEEWQELMVPGSTPRPKDIPDSVGPLLTTTWDQGQYYNALCPEDDNGPDGHVYTGCVATAMAQIINYWGYPVHGRGIHSYESNYGTLRVNYDSANYDYTHMPNALTSSSTEEEIQAVATLMRDCGVAANMDYSITGSASNDVEARAGLINFFKFSPNLSHAGKAYMSNSEWSGLLRKNIDENHPMMYCGQSLGGGHAFVLDGYKQDGYFHFNFGWGGDVDGWYLHDAIPYTGPSGYNLLQSILVDIVPDGNSNVILGQLAGSSTFTVEDPMEFNHMFGYNKYLGYEYGGHYPNVVSFVSRDASGQLVVDIMDYKKQFIDIYDGANSNELNSDSLLRKLSIYGIIDNSPVVSSQNTITMRCMCAKLYDGFKLKISRDGACRTVSNIRESLDSTSLHLMWDENGIDTSWLVEYGPVDFLTGEGSTIMANTNNLMLNIDADSTYEFRIQPMCDTSNDQLINLIIVNRQLYWTDIVNEEPEGYNVEENGTITISSAEGLAWVSKLAATDEEGTNYRYRDLSIVNDIDLSGYLWSPIADWNGSFNGNSYTISNMNVEARSSDGGLFAIFSGDTIQNIGIINANISGYNVGSIAANSTQNTIALNCYSSNYTLRADGMNAGGLFGGIGRLINCYAIGKLGTRHPSGCFGGLVGDASPNMVNCYSSVTEFTSELWCSRGLLCGYPRGGSYLNCFADVDYINDNFVTHFENIDFVQNVAAFTRANNTLAHTIPDTSINYNYSGSVDLVTALNQYVVENNSPLLRVWIWDTLTRLPKLGAYYEVTCPNVSNITASNIPYDGDFAVSLSWVENGSATEWQIKCLPHGIIDEDSAVFSISHDTSIILTGLTLGRKYDIYVCPVCGENNVPIWGDPLSFIVERTYWVDVVTERPDGYVEDENGDIVISSAEGLAWLSVCSNGLNGQVINEYSGKNVFIVNDIDIGTYRWYPICIGWESEFHGTINGYGHVISNIHCNEETENIGLIGHARNATIMNITINGGDVKGYLNVGSLFGRIDWSNVSGCSAKNVTVVGINTVGCLGGCFENWAGNDDRGVFINSHSSGIVYGNTEVGGMLGMSGEKSRIINCFSAASVYAIYTDYPGERRYSGGLIGNAYGVVSNVYSYGFVQESSISSLYSVGSSIGVLSSVCAVNNTYAIRQNNNNPLIGMAPYGTTYVIDTASFDSAGVLETDITVQEVSYSSLLDVLNAWVDAYDTAGIYRHWAPDTTNINGGFPVFAALPCLPTTGSDSITVCNSYTWHGVEYTENAPLMDTLSNMNGCDSIVTHHLIINHSNAGSESVTNCESYFFNGQWIYASGQYYDILTNSDGCDSIVTLNLTINNPVHTAVTETACGSYLWHEATLTSTGDYTYPHNDANGCTQVDTLHLVINYSSLGDTTAAACDRFSWYQHTDITESTDMLTHTFVNAAGCDSTVTLHLTINHSNAGDTSAVACDSFTWWNTNYTNSTNEATHMLTNAVGCDSTVTLHLTINHSNACDTAAVACDRFTWYQHTDITESTDMLTHTFINVAGCDSTVNLHLTINYSNTGDTIIVVACDRFSWYQHTDITESTDMLTHTFINVAGCDSTVNLHLTINRSNNGDTAAVACDRFTWWNTNYTNSTNEATHVLTNVAGCDSTVTLHLMINHSNDTTITETIVQNQLPYTFSGESFNGSENRDITLSNIAGCDSVIHYTLNVEWNSENTADSSVCATQLPLVWNGVTFNTAGTQPVTLTGSNGADSVVIMTLNIFPQSYGDTSATACESFDWYGETYNASGNYTHTLTAADRNGCDSTVTLLLTINHNGSFGESITACDSFAWHGETFTQSGHYTFDTLTTSGCDSTLTLSLTINHSTTGVFTVRACDEYTWHRYTYYESTNEPTYTMPGSNECDSTVTLHLTINYSNAGDTTAVACDSFTWWNTNYTNSTNEATHVLTNMAGCDSTVTLHLTINHSNAGDTAAVACDGFGWGGQWLVASGQYVETLTSVVGCDSTVTLYLTVNHANTGDTAAVACDNFTWWNTDYTNSTNEATHVLTNAAGCDSTVILHLTINHSNTGDTTAVACDYFTWYQHTDITESTDMLTHSFINVSGCDSTVTLHLTINHSNAGDTNAVACDNFIWWNTNYTNSTNEATHVLTNVSGCDSTVTLHLMINRSNTGDTTAVACDHFTWWNTDFTDNTDDATQVLTNVAGCDSTVTLHLTLHYSTESTETVTAESVYEWNGTTYDESGTYIWIGTTSEGCDSTVTLHLTIEPGTTEGINDVTEDIGVKVYTRGNTIVIDFSGQHTADSRQNVVVYDVMGRVVKQTTDGRQQTVVEIPVSGTGVYMVKVGDLKPQKVVVRR